MTRRKDGARFLCLSVSIAEAGEGRHEGDVRNVAFSLGPKQIFNRLPTHLFAGGDEFYLTSDSGL